MGVQHVLGSSVPVTTGISKTGGGDKDSCIVTVEGTINQLESISNFGQYTPSGMTVETHTIEPNGDGTGRLIIRCVDYGSGSVSTTPTRITWKISMVEVQTDIKRHPECVGDLLTIENWLETDPAKRFDEDENPQWIDSEGTPHEISSTEFEKFLSAYKRGIETFNRYFPVIEKISYYKTLPGCSMSGNSTTGGSVSQFSSSSSLGTWDVPNVTLSGFDQSGWFKSGDNYEQGNDLIWVRTEQWTWTPDHGNDIRWIYQPSES